MHELLVTDQCCPVRRLSSRYVCFGSLYLTESPRLLRRSALTPQQRASRVPALQRSYGASEQRDGLSAVSCKDTGVGTGGVRRRRKSAQRISLPQLHVQRHEVIRAQLARRLGGPTEVLCSAQQVCPLLAT